MIATLKPSHHRNMKMSATMRCISFLFSSHPTASSPERRDFMLQELRTSHIIFIYLNIYNDISLYNNSKFGNKLYVAFSSVPLACILLRESCVSFWLHKPILNICHPQRSLFLFSFPVVNRPLLLSLIVRKRCF